MRSFTDWTSWPIWKQAQNVFLMIFVLSICLQFGLSQWQHQNKDIVGLVIPTANNESSGRRLVASAPVVVITLKQRTAEEAAQTAADIDAAERKLQGGCCTDALNISLQILSSKTLETWKYQHLHTLERPWPKKKTIWQELTPSTFSTQVVTISNEVSAEVAAHPNLGR